MKAIAVHPGQPHSAHLEEIPKPRVSEVPNGRGVLVKILRVGVDGTDKEINEALYGAAPPGSPFLVIGHEGFGRVEEVGPNVREFKPGDYVVATVRRPGTSIYDLLGHSDMTTDTAVRERGISFLHGFLTEYYVESADFLIQLPPALEEVGVLLEPMTISVKGIGQAFEIQRRLGAWTPKRALVTGAGTVGLLATLGLRLRGIETTTVARTEGPYLKSELVEALGARYVSVRNRSIIELAQDEGCFDLIFESTGASALAWAGMQALAKDGVLVLTSVTAGHNTLEVPSDEINQSFVLGNKVMVGTVNANREHFRLGVAEMCQAALMYPGWLNRLLTDPIPGLDHYQELFEKLEHPPKSSIKVFMQVAQA